MVDGESVLEDVRDRIGTGATNRRIDRSSENRLKRWILFDGNREQVAVALLAAVFTVLLVMGGICRSNTRSCYARRRWFRRCLTPC